MFKVRLKKQPPDLSDEELFKGITNGNEAMFEELYSRYKKRLLYYFYRMLGNDETLAQDFLQDIFYKVLDKPQLFNTDKKFSTWIFSVAHNMCKNEYRSRDVRRIIIKNDCLDSFIYADNPENTYEFSVKKIYEELNKLDETHQTAFILKYREGFNLEEISNILNLPVGTVKSRLHYTRKKIQKRICKSKDTAQQYKTYSDE